MEGLACGYEIDARGVERRCFRRTSHTEKLLECSQEFLASLTHFGVGLDAKNTIALFEEEFAKKAGARADVRDDVVCAQATLRAQMIEHGRWVAGAVADVVRDAIGESLFGIGKSHVMTRDW